MDEWKPLGYRQKIFSFLLTYKRNSIFCPECSGVLLLLKWSFSHLF